MILLGLIIGIFIILSGFVFENFRLSQPAIRDSAFLNIKYFFCMATIQGFFGPTLAAFAISIVQATGGGMIALPASGWQFFPALLIYFFAMDLGEYLFHRAQHRFALLWSLHALHHSDIALNISTTVRHHWAEYFIKSLTIYPIVGMVFKVDPPIVGFYAIFSFWNYFSHMNVKIGFGRWSFALNSPQYHRLHHSILDEHRNCNFAALFPIFDIVFRSYRAPLPGEYPPSGLEFHEKPSCLTQAILWPIRTLPGWMAIKLTGNYPIRFKPTGSI